MATINADHAQLGMIHAFNSLFGREHVQHYDYFQRMREGCSKEFINWQFADDAIRFKPDWIWLQLQNSDIITAETISKLEKEIQNAVIAHWCGDVRSEVSPYFASICKATHLTLVANKGFIPKYVEAGAREVIYVPHGLDWDEDVLGVPFWEPPFPIPDVVYCGNNYGDAIVGSEVRQAAIRYLHDAGINIGVVGNGWLETGLRVLGQCKVKQQVHIYERAKVVLSVNHFPDLAGYHGDRTITAMAYFPEIEKEFVDGEDLLVFRNHDELIEKTLTLLSHDRLRRELGIKGRAAAIKNHTWFSRIFGILPRVQQVWSKLST